MQQYVGIELENRYLLKQVVDAGSFGAVYDAVDQKFDSRVAIKILFESHVDSHAFRSEALLARRFRHPNVVEVFEFGVDSEHGVAYIVMEFLQGTRVDQLIAESDCEPHLFDRFVDQIGSALDTAHSRQLVHRDLKPQNVMLVDRGQPTERFVLLDLGVATKTDSMTTLRNQALDGAMSPQYASPEQIKRKEVDYRSDVYSFGTILYEWLTGQPPFTSDNLLGLANAICRDTPVRPCELTDQPIHPEVEEVVLQCLAKNPARRPESIGEVRTRILDVVESPRRISGDASSSGDTSSGGELVETTEEPSAAAHARTLVPSSEDSFGTTLKVPTAPQRDAPTWQKSRRRTSPLWFLFAAILCVLGVAAALFFNRANAIQLVTPASIEVPAGGETTATLKLIGTDSSNEGLRLEFIDVPEWLKISAPPMPVQSDSVRITLHGALQPEAETATVKIQATHGERTTESAVDVRLAPPVIWLPKGFQPVGQELVRSRAHDVTVYREISRQRGDQVMVFVLVASPEKLPPFYVMTDKVWNALLLQFATANPRIFPPVPDRTQWRQGAMANGEPLGVEHNPMLPTMNLTAFEAHDLAQWIGGSTAHLPTVEQWDVAAGLERWRNGGLPETAWKDGPFKTSTGRSEVAVGLRPFGPRAVGTSADDISPFGCRDMAGNGLELTASLIGNARVPDCNEDAWVQTRGRSYQADSPLEWNELEASARADYPDGIEAGGRNPNIGFRVVVEISDH
jgi:serine/threonine protein kinase/formylglycine-generating enzyme required for sulfatase activity